MVSESVAEFPTDVLEGDQDSPGGGGGVGSGSHGAVAAPSMASDEAALAETAAAAAADSGRSSRFGIRVGMSALVSPTRTATPDGGAPLSGTRGGGGGRGVGSTSSDGARGNGGAAAVASSRGGAGPTRGALQHPGGGGSAGSSSSQRASGSPLAWDLDSDDDGNSGRAYGMVRVPARGSSQSLSLTQALAAHAATYGVADEDDDADDADEAVRGNGVPAQGWQAGMSTRASHGRAASALDHSGRRAQRST